MRKAIQILAAFILITGNCSAQCNEVWNTPDMPLCGPAGIIKLPNNKILLLSGNQYCQPSLQGSAYTIVDLVNGNTINEYIDTATSYSLNWLDESHTFSDSIVEIIGKGISYNGQWHSLVGKVNTNTLLMDTLFVYPTIDSVGAGDDVFSTTTKKNGKSYYTATAIQVGFIPGPASLKLRITKMDENGILIWRKIIDETSMYNPLGGSPNTGCTIINDNLIVSYLHGNVGGAARIYACDSLGTILFTADQHSGPSVYDIQNVLGVFKNQNNNSFYVVSQVPASLNGAVRIKEYSFTGSLLNSVNIPASSFDPSFEIMNIMEALPLSNGNILVYGDGSPTAAEWWKSDVFAMTINSSLQETWFQKYAYADAGKSLARDVIVWDTAHFDVVGWLWDSTYQFNYKNQGVGIVRMNTDGPPQACYYNDTVTHSSSIYLFAEKLNNSSEFVVAFQGEMAGLPVNSGSTVIKIGESTGLGNETLNENEKINVYPNPSFDHISIVSSENIEKISLYDLHGRIIFENNTVKEEPLQIDVSVLKAGTYILYITSNHQVTHKKIIVTR